MRELQGDQSIMYYAACRLDSYDGSGVSGLVKMSQKEGEPLFMQASVKGLSPGLHGFHVHTLGDLADGCGSTGGHFNPEGVAHGAYDAEVRHAGDLKMIEAD